MANQTSFDLNAAIQTWRENLANSPAFRRESLNELESHLRDSIAALQSRSLSAEEAFMIATKRLGKSGVLEEEFGKVNAKSVWLDRALWILLAYQAWILVSNFSFLMRVVISTLGTRSKDIFSVEVICSPIVMGIIATFLAWRFVRGNRGVAAVIEKSLQKPWALGSVVLLTCLVLRVLAELSYRWCAPAFNSYAPHLSLYSGLMRDLSVVWSEYAILAALTVLVARKRLRASVV